VHGIALYLYFFAAFLGGAHGRLGLSRRHDESTMLGIRREGTGVYLFIFNSRHRAKIELALLIGP
jgi:hypothetical protein